MTINPTTLATLTGVVLPVVVGLLTRLDAPARVKVVANIVLSGVAAVLLNAVNADGYAVVSWDMVALYAQQTAVAIATYVGVYKPLNVGTRLAPTRGLGHTVD